MMDPFDACADIKIYNYKTREIHSEKALVLIHEDTGKILAVGNDCERFALGNEMLRLVAPIALGRVVDYNAAEALFKWLHHKYILNKKYRLFKGNKKGTICHHEPCSRVDAKYYSDLIFSLGYKSVILISTEVVGAKPEDMTLDDTLTLEDALWEIGARDNKVECAFEVTKEDPYRYAKCACGRFLSNCKRWGVDPKEISKEF
ncbi:MAG: rod shape-determining protein [Lachnospiraceae bacterium]|nr:rod shape-determining protein [Lachnospiraceae bacterium]